MYEYSGFVLVTFSKFAAEENVEAKALLKYFTSYIVVLATAIISDVHNELAALKLKRKNVLFREIKPVMDATVSKLSFMQTIDGKCLTYMKSEIEKKDDGVFFKEKTST